MNDAIFRICRLSITIVAAILLSFVGDAIAEPKNDQPDVKIIIFGGVPSRVGGISTPSTLAKYIDRAAGLPIDGMIMNITNIGGYYSDVFYGAEGPDGYVPQIYSYDEQVKPEVEIMRSLNLGNLKHNFSRMNIGNLRPDWFDDEAWDVILQNVVVGARATREMGAVGILIDTEQYNFAKKITPFSYEQLNRSEDLFFEDYVKQVRKRGRQFMEAINSEMTNVDLMFTYANGYLLYPFAPNRRAISSGEHSLTAAFLDGMMDVATAETEFIDGFENAYYFKSEAEFRRARYMIKYKAAKFSSNPERYIGRIKVGFGLMPHGGTREYSLKADITKNTHTPEELANVLRWAGYYSDGYIWLYGLPWIDVPAVGSSLPEAYTQVIRDFRDGKPAQTRPTYTFRAKRMNKSNATPDADPVVKNWVLDGGDYVLLATDPDSGNLASGTGAVAFSPRNDEPIADGNYRVEINVSHANIKKHPKDRSSDRNGSFSYRLSLHPNSSGRLTFTHPIEAGPHRHHPQDPDNTNWPDYRGMSALTDFVAYGAQARVEGVITYITLSNVQASDLVFELSDEVRANYGMVGFKSITLYPAGYHHDSTY